MHRWCSLQGPFALQRFSWNAGTFSSTIHRVLRHQHPSVRARTAMMDQAHFCPFDPRVLVKNHARSTLVRPKSSLSLSVPGRPPEFNFSNHFNLQNGRIKALFDSEPDRGICALFPRSVTVEVIGTVKKEQAYFSIQMLCYGRYVGILWETIHACKK
jgi:hypothetical protein